MNRLALRWTILTHMHRWTQKGTSNQVLAQTHTYTHNQKANNIFPSSRQIQFLSKTYVSWLKRPTKTGEICHILQDGTQYWVLLWQWHAFSSLSFSTSFSRDLSTSPDGIMHPFQSFLYLFPPFFPLCDFPPSCPWKGKHIIHDRLWKAFYEFIHAFFLFTIHT